MDVQKAVFDRRQRILDLEKTKKIRTVRISKKEIFLLEVIDTERCMRVKLHLQMTWYDMDYTEEDASDLSVPQESNAARDANGNFLIAGKVGEKLVSERTRRATNMILCAHVIWMRW